MCYSAFTSFYEGIANALKNKVEIIANDFVVQVDALWDTGATATCISHDVVKSLKLVPIGRQNINTPSGTKTMNTYCVDIILPNNVAFKDIL